jgi:hypothetical protein
MYSEQTQATPRYIGAGAGMPNPNQPIDRPTSQVESNQQYIDEAIKRLSETVAHLGDRLSPVLLPCGPAMDAPNQNKIAEILVPVAERAHQQGCAIQRISDTLGDFLKRLAI